MDVLMRRLTVHYLVSPGDSQRSWSCVRRGARESEAREVNTVKGLWETDCQPACCVRAEKMRLHLKDSSVPPSRWEQ